MGAKSYIFCFLERHAKIQKLRQTPCGRKVSGRKKKEEERRRRRKNNAMFSGHYVCPTFAPILGQVLSINACSILLDKTHLLVVWLPGTFEYELIYAQAQMRNKGVHQINALSSRVQCSCLPKEVW